MSQKILVTGGTGFIGSHLVSALLKQAHSVTTLARTATTAGQSQSLQHIAQDLSDPRVTELLPKDFDVIYHLASTANVRFSVEKPLEDFSANVHGTLHLLEYMRRFNPKAKLVLASTVSVVDTAAVKPIVETAHTRPSSPYGASKLAAEAYCQAYASTYDVDARIVRMFNVYGPGIHRLFIYDIYKKLMASPQSLEMMGDGKQIRDYVYVSDVVRMLQLTAENGSAGEIYNCCSGQPIELKELVFLMIDQLGLGTVGISHVPSYPGDIKEWYGDLSKTRQKLGFQPQISLKDGLNRTLASFSS